MVSGNIAEASRRRVTAGGTARTVDAVVHGTVRIGAVGHVVTLVSGNITEASCRRVAVGGATRTVVAVDHGTVRVGAV